MSGNERAHGALRTHLKKLLPTTAESERCTGGRLAVKPDSVAPPSRVFLRDSFFPLSFSVSSLARTHARTHARKYARTHARTPARTHERARRAKLERVRALFSAGRRETMLAGETRSAWRCVRSLYRHNGCGRVGNQAGQAEPNRTKPTHCVLSFAPVDDRTAPRRAPPRPRIAHASFTLSLSPKLAHLQRAVRRPPSIRLCCSDDYIPLRAR